jgi:hypothetical protein
MNINRQIIEEFVEDGADSEEHSTSVESIEDISSIEIIPTTVEKDRKARAKTQTPVSTTTTATPKQKRERVRKNNERKALRKQEPGPWTVQEIKRERKNE